MKKYMNENCELKKRREKNKVNVIFQVKHAGPDVIKTGLLHKIISAGPTQMEPCLEC